MGGAAARLSAVGAAPRGGAIIETIILIIIVIIVAITLIKTIIIIVIQMIVIIIIMIAPRPEEAFARRRPSGQLEVGGALHALIKNPEQSNPSQSFSFIRENALLAVQGEVSERLREALRGFTLRLRALERQLIKGY